MRDQFPVLSAKNLVILGVSFDTPEENRAFREKFAFPYDLLSDTTRSMGLAYGAASSARQGYAQRNAVLIGPDGRVARVEENVSPSGFAATVLAWLG